MPLFRNPPRGFRLSPLDLVFLAVGVLAVVLTRGLPGDPSTLIAIVVGHFFLFCNVVRLRRAFELAWAAVFVALAVIGWGLGTPGWIPPLVFISPYTVLLVILEIRSGRYHGAGADGRLVGWLRGTAKGSRLKQAVLLILGAVVLAGVEAGSVKARTVLRDLVAREAAVPLRGVRVAAREWRSKHPDSPCPTFGDLVEAGLFDRRTTGVDLWNHPIIIECHGPEVIVTSAGPDGVMGTGDDVRVPRR